MCRDRKVTSNQNQKKITLKKFSANFLITEDATNLTKTVSSIIQGFVRNSTNGVLAMVQITGMFIC